MQIFSSAWKGYPMQNLSLKFFIRIFFFNLGLAHEIAAPNDRL